MLGVLQPRRGRHLPPPRTLAGCKTASTTNHPNRVASSSGARSVVSTAIRHGEKWSTLCYLVGWRFLDSLCRLNGFRCLDNFLSFDGPYLLDRFPLHHGLCYLDRLRFLDGLCLLNGFRCLDSFLSFCGLNLLDCFRLHTNLCYLDGFCIRDSFCFRDGFCCLADRLRLDPGRFSSSLLGGFLLRRLGGSRLSLKKRRPPQLRHMRRLPGLGNSQVRHFSHDPVEVSLPHGVQIGVRRRVHEVDGVGNAILNRKLHRVQVVTQGATELEGVLLDTLEQHLFVAPPLLNIPLRVRPARVVGHDADLL